jgi:hypothetical protein
VFQGTIPPGCRSMIQQHSHGWPAGPVYIGCSGNLTIERVLNGRFELHSNDVNPYSCALGWYFAGEPLLYQLKDDDETQRELGWIAEYLDGGTQTLAVLMLGSRFLSWVGKTQPYYVKMLQAWRDQFPRALADTVATLEANTLKLASFFAGDVREHLASAPRDRPFVSFPPFWANGYEVMFKGISERFTWPEPDYQVLSDADLNDLLDLIVDRPHWMLGLSTEHEEPPQLDGYRRGLVQTSVRNMPIMMYSSGTGSRVIRPHQTNQPPLIEKISPDDELGDTITVRVLPANQFNALRSQFLNHGIAPGAMQVMAGVFVDGKLIGAFGGQPANYDRTAVYLMSDFPIGWSRYLRLSKLIVMAAMSREAQRLYQRAFNRRITRFSSTAFTNRESSAKYGRGIPEVIRESKNPAKDGVHKWAINYGGPVGRWTLAEALAEWKKRHGSHQRKDQVSA